MSLQFVKQQLDLPHRIDELHFSMMSPEEVLRLSVLPCRRTGPREREFSVNDPRLGVCERNATCLTCGQKQAECPGHHGHVKLELPVFHLGYFTAVLRICRTICKRCSHVLLSDVEKEYYKRKFLSGRLDPLQHTALAKSIQIEAYKTRVCPNCSAANGVVRRMRPLRMIHERFSVPNAEEAYDEFHDLLKSAVEFNKDVGDAIGNAQDFLDPQRVLSLLQAIPPEEVILLGMKSGTRPESLLFTCLPVTPLPTRPFGPAQTGSGIREDELSMQYNDIIASCDQMRDDRMGSVDPAKAVENWEMLQLKVARLLDGALPGFPAQLKGTIIKSFAQRMKGKHGRFRGNLSGKRVNYSGRSVISPDPNLDIDELAIPLRIAKNLTYPQRVFEQNLARMRQLVLNGPDCHPGACFVVFSKEKTRKDLRFDREAVAARLRVGDIVERHVINGDLLLFNRQPSLHRLSMMCHKARVLPFRTLRFNECCCAPYNADFDGDEMNIHLVQTEEARAEALNLMSTKKNIITPKNGEPIISCTQDFLTGAYMMTSLDMFLDRTQFSQAVSHWLAPGESFDLPKPAIFAPVELWTGKQLFGLITRPRRSESDKLNFEATAKYYVGGGARFSCPEDGYIAFFNSQLIAGRLDKKILGGGAKEGLFASLNNAVGCERAAQCMNRIARVTSRWLMNYGFSLGLGDVFPTPSLLARKGKILEDAFAVCDSYISEANAGTLTPAPGMTVKQTLEAKLNSELSKVREECGTQAVGVLTRSNVPLNMALSGGKGSTLNIAQMMACVGQQTVRGKRIPNSFIDRSLPHFPRHAQQPSARGFVANSFFTSLTPTEFYFHTMAGREGLVDTAVKTAETGYIYRRLMKAMEDMSVQYDFTVRNSKRDIVQFHYGEDMLDPVLMEGAQSTPINFSSTWLSVVSEKRANSALHKPLLPGQAERLVSRRLALITSSVSQRFVEDLRKFLLKKIADLRTVRKQLGLGDDDIIGSEWSREAVHLTRYTVISFIDLCAAKYRSKICEPGTPCGAIAAQSVGEPSTQMTLRTFHFAGIASMSITQGVPRLVEVINANKSIATPIIRAPLINNDPLSSQVIKSMMERVMLKEILLEAVEVIAPGTSFLKFKLHRRLISDLQLSLEAHDVVNAILQVARRPMSPLRLLRERHFAVESRDTFVVYPYHTEAHRLLFNLKHLAEALPEVVVSGIPNIKRGIVQKDKNKNLELLAEGDELRSVMVLPGVDGRRTTCNHVASVEKVLGIEAARQTIVNEIGAVMSAYSLNIDTRHLFLLADVMTHLGTVLGITRFGIQKMNTSVLTMASFERTTEQLYDAAVYQRMDHCSSVSENIVVGSPIPLGTNSVNVMQATPRSQVLSGARKRPPLLSNFSGDFNVGLSSQH